MSKFKPYRLMLASLPAGVSEYDFTLDSEFFRAMENPDVLDADVHVHLRLEHKNDAYYCHFTLRGKLLIPCDRCLEAMPHDIDEVYDITVKHGPEYDDSADGVLIIPDTATTLDLTEMLYDTVVLTIPMRHVHEPGGCNETMTGLLHDHGADSAPDNDTDNAES